MKKKPAKKPAKKQAPEPEVQPAITALRDGSLIRLSLHSSVFAYDDARLGALVRSAYLEARSK